MFPGTQVQHYCLFPAGATVEITQRPHQRFCRTSQRELKPDTGTAPQRSFLEAAHRELEPTLGPPPPTLSSPCNLHGDY
ncbi:hypothetical protein ACRE_060000 [Hapsidospora chrysogenum ATCC 11550]|uniref:Uncharacterized protein n=1 Tax=Hapsidospora chrysogenum (strain ATCC 11550 / CBS 779.69 / DSM 880 / IAM 14645 / JCM 23072 / IMI 49137) TaxID=857340 RepID=A0A086T1L3_HAPC1|nr:hypothetical protein ACRE_060000 [Hapsidospora chrysogenum ATCC 11550]